MTYVQAKARLGKTPPIHVPTMMIIKSGLDEWRGFRIWVSTKCITCAGLSIVRTALGAFLHVWKVSTVVWYNFSSPKLRPRFSVQSVLVARKLVVVCRTHRRLILRTMVVDISAFHIEHNIYWIRFETFRFQQIYHCTTRSKLSWRGHTNHYRF